MPFKNQWIIENRVLFGRSIGRITIAEFEENSRFLLGILNDPAVERLELLVDETGIESLPNNILKLTKTMDWLRHEKMGWMVTYGNPNAIIRRVASLGATMTGLKLRNYDSKADAIAFMQNLAEDMPDVASALATAEL